MRSNSLGEGGGLHITYSAWLKLWTGVYIFCAVSAVAAHSALSEQTTAPALFTRSRFRYISC
jgi:hypothetical protein